MTTPNPIRLGPDSPLLTPARAKRLLAPLEADMQIAVLAHLVGPAIPGMPRGTGGLAVRYPTLRLVYAIHPNVGGTVRAAKRGREKAMGVLADLPDLCLPVATFFAGALYVELKRPGQTPRPSQRARHRELRDAGNLVVWCDTVADAVDAFEQYAMLYHDPASSPPLQGLYVRCTDDWHYLRP